MPGHYKCSQLSLSPFTCAVSFVSVWVVMFCGLVVLGFLLLLFLTDFRITVSILIQWWLCMMSFIPQKLQSCNIQLVTGWVYGPDSLLIIWHTGKPESPSWVWLYLIQGIWAFQYFSLPVLYLRRVDCTSHRTILIEASHFFFSCC